jgi:hypothetical protein
MSDGKDEGTEQKKTPVDGALVELARFSGHGLTIALSTGLFLLAGWWLDGRLGTLPLFTVLGALTGAAAGLYSLLQHVLLGPRAREREKAEEVSEGNSTPPAEGANEP